MAWSDKSLLVSITALSMAFSRRSIGCTSVFLGITKGAFVVQWITGIDRLNGEGKVRAMDKVIEQQIEIGETGLSLVSKFASGAVSSEPISGEEAAQWQAEYGR